MKQITITTSKSHITVDELVDEYSQQLFQLVYAYVKNYATAEDLTQEIFIKCYRNLGTFKGQSTVKTWLWRIAINHTKDYLKSWYKQSVETTDDSILHTYGLSQSTEAIVEQEDEDAALAQAVMALPVNYREVIYLFYFEEMSIKEMASILKKNENTIKSRMRKGKQLLKQTLEAL